MTGLKLNSVVFNDMALRCVECGEEFTFSAGEQRYFTSKQLSQPRRCHECIQFRKRTLNPAAECEVQHDNR